MAQKKISSLEEELSLLRRDNEKLVSAGGVLEEKIESLKAQNETLSAEKEESDKAQEAEKETFLNALEESRIKTDRLESAKRQLEKRLAGGLENVRGRENTLENKIEIMKLEQSVLQKEKDKIIIDLRREIYKMKNNLKITQSKNQDTQLQLSRMRERLLKTVSVLRAAVSHLESGDWKAQKKAS